MAKQIFVSYSHVDERWRAVLVEALVPLARPDEIEVWDDRSLAPGDRWAERIEEQIERSDVAVLLVSASFLASAYIADVELPRIIAAADEGRLTLIWVPVSASLWDMTALARFQAGTDPKTPLESMPRPRARAALISVARKIAAARTLSNLGRGMGVADAVYDELSDTVGRRRVVARRTSVGVAFEDQDANRTIEVIVADELEELPDDQHRLIKSLEEGMTEEYERWTTLRPRRRTLTGREQQEYVEAGRLMCEELQHILDFIEKRLGKHLEDHYHGVRFACEKLVSSSGP